MNENLTKYLSSEISIVKKINIAIFWVVTQHVSIHSSKEHNGSASTAKMQAVCSSETWVITYCHWPKWFKTTPSYFPSYKG